MSEISNENVVVNPIDEYLNNYKELKLAEMCVEKDKEIDRLDASLKFMEKQCFEFEQKARCVENVESLYKMIMGLSVNDYMKLYHLFTKTIKGIETSTINLSTDDYWDSTFTNCTFD